MSFKMMRKMAIGSIGSSHPNCVSNILAEAGGELKVSNLGPMYLTECFGGPDASYGFEFNLSWWLGKQMMAQAPCEKDAGRSNRFG